MVSVSLCENNPFFVVSVSLCENMSMILYLTQRHKDHREPVGVAEFLLTKKLPEKFKNALPTAEDIKNKLFGK